MHFSVISKAVFIVIALLVLVSCDHVRSKVKTHMTREIKSETNAAPAKSVTMSRAKPATEASATRKSRVASAPTMTTTKNTAAYNGITQFDVR